MFQVMKIEAGLTVWTTSLSAFGAGHALGADAWVKGTVQRRAAPRVQAWVVRWDHGDVESTVSARVLHAGAGADRAPCFAQALGDLPRYAEVIRAQLRCTICGRKASYCCRACSKPDVVVTVCGMGTGRACWSQYCSK